MFLAVVVKRPTKWDGLASKPKQLLFTGAGGLAIGSWNSKMFSMKGLSPGTIIDTVRITEWKIYYR